MELNGGTVENVIRINGEEYPVPSDCPPEMSLNDFLREVLEMKGTKVLCREAGCGCCIVTASYLHPKSGKIVSNPVSSCLCPVYAAVGWNVTTIEGLGGQGGKNYHPLQERLAERFGSQCGYCSPGFVMSMFSGLNNNPTPSSAEVEHFFDGNICRCTGYRPILDAMKTFAKDSKDAEATALDIEDLQNVCCKDKLERVQTSGLMPISKGWNGQRFYNPGKLEELLQLLSRHQTESVRLLFGNTSAGIFKEDANADVYINTRNTQELYKHELNDAGLELGANTSLNELIKIFNEVGHKVPKLKHLIQLSEHLQVVANQAVRSSGCWAGNLMIKHAHPEFPSDLFILFEASRAVLSIVDFRGSQREYRLVDFLQEDMRSKVIVSVKFPAMATKQHEFRSYKITPRATNAHAYVNVAFHFSLDGGRNVTELPSIVIGGISGKFHHATKTENFLQNKCLTDDKTMEEAAAVLESEIVPLEEECASTPEHRRRLASNLLYKFARGEPGRERVIVESEQNFEEPSNPVCGAPLGKSIPKLEAKAQTSGSAMFSNDFPAHKNELFASFVLSPEAPVKLNGFETKQAEAVPGYVCLITAKDITDWGFLNNKASTMIPEAFRPVEEILASEKADFAGQPVAVVLAKSQSVADQCSQLVEVLYESDADPITDIQDAMIKNSVFMEFPQTVAKGDAEGNIDQSPVHVEGEVAVGEQFHFCMEPITASVQPTEEGLVIHAPHQWVDLLVSLLTHVLKLPSNKIRVVMPRIGGGFGGKMLMVDHVVSILSICALKLNKPVRMYMTLDRFLEFAMKRPAMFFKYKVGASKEGKLESIVWHIYSDEGYLMSMNSMITEEAANSIDTGYYCPNFTVNRTLLKTSKNMSTFCRGPGPLPASAANIIMMDHLSKTLGIDPIKLKEMNLYKPGDTDLHDKERQNDNYQEMWKQLLEDAEIDKRRKHIQDFNTNNKYRRRGLDIAASSYHFSFGRPKPSIVSISIQANDGMVSVSHSGSEMGQGLGVKVAQAVAGILEISLDMIRLRPTDSYIVPNGDVTGGSVSSELNVMAAIEAAKTMQERLKPFRAAKPDLDWVSLVNAASSGGACLHVVQSYKSPAESEAYYTTGVGAVEVELDCLTGEYSVVRTDILMDLGRSLNPGVDIGQIEGAFVMGLGYCMSEKTVYSESDGRLLSRGTWNYKVPLAGDIPRNFRVHLLKGSSNPKRPVSTKAVGEPPICLSPLVVTALLHAVEDWRVSMGKPAVATPGRTSLPLTPDKVLSELLQVEPIDRKVC